MVTATGTPTPGCWQLTLGSGRGTRRVVMIAVKGGRQAGNGAEPLALAHARTINWATATPLALA